MKKLTDASFRSIIPYMYTVPNIIIFIYLKVGINYKWMDK